jgi:hypothetical protein
LLILLEFTYSDNLTIPEKCTDAALSRLNFTVTAYQRFIGVKDQSLITAISVIILFSRLLSDPLTSGERGKLNYFSSSALVSQLISESLLLLLQQLSLEDTCLNLPLELLPHQNDNDNFHNLLVLLVRVPKKKIILLEHVAKVLNFLWCTSPSFDFEGILKKVGIEVKMENQNMFLIVLSSIRLHVRLIQRVCLSNLLEPVERLTKIAGNMLSLTIQLLNDLNVMVHYKIFMVLLSEWISFVGMISGNYLILSLIFIV